MKIKYGFFRMPKIALARENCLSQIMQHFDPSAVCGDNDRLDSRLFYGTSPMFEAIDLCQKANEYHAMFRTINGYDIFVGFEKVEV